MVAESSTKQANDSKPWLFKKGTAGGPGNPMARRVARLRAEMLKAVSPEDINAISCKLVEQAKKGDVASAKEVLDRTLGKPAALDLDADRTLTEKTFADLCSILVELTRRRFGSAADDLFAEILSGGGRG